MYKFLYNIYKYVFFVLFQKFGLDLRFAANQEEVSLGMYIQIRRIAVYNIILSPVTEFDKFYLKALHVKAPLMIST